MRVSPGARGLSPCYGSGACPLWSLAGDRTVAVQTYAHCPLGGVLRAATARQHPCGVGECGGLQDPLDQPVPIGREARSGSALQWKRGLGTAGGTAPPGCPQLPGPMPALPPQLPRLPLQSPHCNSQPCIHVAASSLQNIRSSINLPQGPHKSLLHECSLPKAGPLGASPLAGTRSCDQLTTSARVHSALAEQRACPSQTLLCQQQE